MVKVTLELPAKTFIRTVDGKAINLDWSRLPASVVAKIAEGGAKVILTNAYNGGGKDAPESQKVAQLNKRIDAWERGEYVMVERGETQFTAMKEVFIADCIAAGMTTGEASKLITAKIAERLPKDSKATFSNYLDATALEYVEAGEFDNAAEARDALEAHYLAKVAEAEKARAKASAKIVLPSIDLSAFKKTK